MVREGGSGARGWKWIAAYACYERIGNKAKDGRVKWRGIRDIPVQTRYELFGYLPFCLRLGLCLLLPYLSAQSDIDETEGDDTE